MSTFSSITSRLVDGDLHFQRKSDRATILALGVGGLGLGPAEAVTIASGVATVTKSFVRLSAETTTATRSPRSPRSAQPTATCCCWCRWPRTRSPWTTPPSTSPRPPAPSLPAAACCCTTTATTGSGQSCTSPPRPTTRAPDMPVTRFGGSVKVVRVDWVSDTGGDATETIHIDGEILRVVTIPGAGGLAPTDLYDITLVDEDGLDIMNGDLGNRSTSAAEPATIAPRVIHYGPLMFTVANAGSQNAGTAKIYVR